jgi:hypothetical protein
MTVKRTKNKFIQQSDLAPILERLTKLEDKVLGSRTHLSEPSHVGGFDDRLAEIERKHTYFVQAVTQRLIGIHNRIDTLVVEQPTPPLQPPRKSEPLAELFEQELQNPAILAAIEKRKNTSSVPEEHRDTFAKLLVTLPALMKHPAMIEAADKLGKKFDWQAYATALASFVRHQPTPPRKITADFIASLASGQTLLGDNRDNKGKFSLTFGEIADRINKFFSDPE